jgi:hypothetical protein
VRIDDITVKPRGSAVRTSKYVELEGTLKVRSYVYLGTTEDDVADKGGSDTMKKTAVPPPGGG